MSGISEQFADYVAPRSGSINIVALAALTGSAAQYTGITGTPGATTGIQYIDIGCDQTFYLQFAASGTSFQPTIASGSTTPAAAMGPYLAGVQRFRIYPESAEFRAVTATAGTLRWYKSSGDQRF